MKKPSCLPRPKLVLVYIVALATLATGAVQASSLWSPNSGSLYSIHHNWQVGDLVTVLIVEQAQATQTAGTETNKKSGINMGLDIPVQALQAIGTDIDISGGDNLKSTGKTVRGGSLKARLTATVTEVTPNNNLRIEGRQSIVVNGETQEIVISGLIRQQDIAADNTVLSGAIADAQIAYKGAGTLGAKQEQGFLTRFFHWLF